MDMRLFDTRVTRVVVDVYGMNACGTCLQLVPGRAVLQGGIRGGGRRLVLRTELVHSLGVSLPGFMHNSVHAGEETGSAWANRSESG